MPAARPIARVAMWSGPRNISTALMRSWGNRSDTVVCDEPFYACYLQATGRDHPGAEEVMAAGQTEWRKVVEQLLSDNLPGGKRVFYQKQMAHHLLPEIDREWIGRMKNCFLIRDPREVIVSYLKKNADPTVEDLGFVQQAEIFRWVRERTGAIPPVVDARDVLGNPRKVLGLLCDALSVKFMDSMLSWLPGPRATDGIWAKHWYGEVETSTGFRKPSTGEPPLVPERLRDVYEGSRECYDQLYARRLR